MARKATRFTRIVILVWVIAGALLLTEIVRGVVALGPFNTVTPGVAGLCRPLAVEGPGDLAMDPTSHMLFIAAGNRRVRSPADGLYVLDTSDPRATPRKLSGTPADFHPYAISLLRDPGGLALAAVNWRSDGRSAVDIFKINTQGGVKLDFQTAIEGGLLSQVGGIALLPGGRFYVANVFGSDWAALRWIEKYGLLPRANALFFNGMAFSKSVQGLAMPEGLLVSGSRLYITSANERRLLAFSIDPFSGTLHELGSLSLPARLGHLTADGAHSLIVAGQPKAAAITGYDRDPAKPSPSVVFRVALDASGVPQSYTQLYGDDGRHLGASSSVARAGKRLFIGSGLDSKLLDCTLK